MMRQIYFCLSLFASLLCFVAWAEIPSAEKVILKVILNEEDQGELLLLLKPDGDILVSTEDFQQMGFTNISNVEEEKYISLRSLAPKVTYKLNEKIATLQITADPSLLKTYTVDEALQSRNKVIRTQDTAAFLNYSVAYDWNDASKSASWSAPLEFGLSMKSALAFNSFAYNNGAEQQEDFVRLASNLTFDQPDRRRRLVLGDFSTFSGELGGGGSFGGISLATNFSLDPYFTKVPGLDLAGYLQTPSDVEVYVNGQLVDKQHFSPGQFQFTNLRNFTGAGEVMMIIRDAYGREERIFVPFYLSSSLLKKGVSEYSYNFGYQREGIGQTSFDYEEPAFLAFHRYGFSEKLTSGFRAELERNLLNFGPTATFVLGSAGEMSSSLAYSRTPNTNGYAASLHYTYIRKGWNTQISARVFSRDYENIGGVTEQQPKLQAAATFGFVSRLGSLSASYSRMENYLLPAVSITSLVFSRPVGRHFSLLLRGGRRYSEGVSYDLFAGLNFFFGKHSSGALTYRKQDDETSATASLQKNASRQQGFAYRLFAELNEDRKSGSVAIDYGSRVAITSVDYRNIGGTNGYSFKLAGAMTFMDRGVYWSRPIHDGFALVRVGELDNIRIYLSNQPVGRTSGGTALIPDLVSYYENNLSIEDRDLPQNYEVKETRKYVAPSYRGGSLLRFDVKKFQTFEGYLYMMKDGKRKAAEYAFLEIKLPASVKTLETAVGRKGYFYIENLPSGKIPATLYMDDDSCSFYFNIPKSEDLTVNLGEVTCQK